MTQNNRGAITSHFITFFGVPTEIRPRPVPGFGEVAVLEFAPRGYRSTWRYATNGMSAYRQHHPSLTTCVRTEIYATTRERQTWVEELLFAIVGYPHYSNTFLAEGDSIDVGQPIDRRASPYTGILLMAPGPHDPPNLGLVGGVDESILVHQVVGLQSPEVEYAAGGNGRKLCDAIRAADELCLDVPRKEAIFRGNCRVVKSTGQASRGPDGTER
jgi:hypothetical protein